MTIQRMYGSWMPFLRGDVIICFFFFFQFYLRGFLPHFFKCLKLVRCVWGWRGEWIDKYRNVISWFPLIPLVVLIRKCGDSFSYQWFAVTGNKGAKCPTIFVRAVQNKEFFYPMGWWRLHWEALYTLKGL